MHIEALETGSYIAPRQLFAVIAAVMADGKITREDLPALKEYADSIFERFVRPFDIPGVPNIIEPRVDDAIKRMIPFVIDALADRFLPAEGDNIEPWAP